MRSACEGGFCLAARAARALVGACFAQIFIGQALDAMLVLYLAEAFAFERSLQRVVFARRVVFRVMKMRPPSCRS